MALLVTDPLFEDALRAERQASGSDRYDEVWDGVYVMSPIPNPVHQEIVGRLAAVLMQLVGWSSGNRVYPGVNVSDRVENWKENYRVPDVAVFLENTQAREMEAHWVGGPDFAVEVESDHDRSREKLPFYANVGVRELLLIGRDPWAIELHRLEHGRLQALGCILPGDSAAFESMVLPARFRLVKGGRRPLIEVSRLDNAEQWLI